MKGPTSSRTRSQGTRDRLPVRKAAGFEKALRSSERVFLRKPEEADRHELLALRRKSWGFLRPWEPTPGAGRDPLGDAWFDAYLDAYPPERYEKLLLCARTDGRILGCCNLSEITRGILQSAYLGYWVGEPHARRGYMTEALPLVLDHTFATLRLHRVEANIRPENEASIALVRRIGFRREGYSPRYLRIDGAWRDHERWAYLAEDWADTAAE